MGIETLALGSMVASAGSSIIGGIGQQQQYAAQAATARYQAQVAENNKLIAEQNATLRSPRRARRTPRHETLQLGPHLGGQLRHRAPLASM